MRNEFSQWLEQYARTEPRAVFLTGDLGFNAFEKISEAFGDRFVNCGVSEQNMVSVAASLAQQGLRPLCYSIAPFMAFRPAEQIRLDICLHARDVKIIGNGGGYGYGIMGATHHALEDIAVLSSFAGLRCFIPTANEDVAQACDAMMDVKGPAYLRLGLGTLPANAVSSNVHQGLRILKCGSDLTVLGLGPITLNALKACEDEKIQADIFAAAELPLTDHAAPLLESVSKTGRLLIVEEHVSRGGLAEHAALILLKAGLAPRCVSVAAAGYPNGLYGSQAYHQKISGLDASSLANTLREMRDSL